MTLDQKIMEYQSAMERYNQSFFYQKAGIVISLTVVILQMVTLLNLLCQYHFVGWMNLFFSLFFAYLCADFINGLVHMYMDNNTNYGSFAGPFVAAFHLHHKTPQYKDQHPLKIYFLESGTKYWLVVFLFVLLIFQIKFNLPSMVNFFLVSFGILSSFAELSHYWCHNSRKNQKIITFLQRFYILLPKKHHSHHHLQDNMNYAFLNGLTDPLINFIAKFLYEGYKNNADQHVNAYNGLQTNNR